ncbi:MAG: hypothetical protein WDZ35_00175, partial [Crocinitomicaceae bacterium]
MKMFYTLILALAFSSFSYSFESNLTTLSSLPPEEPCSLAEIDLVNVSTSNSFSGGTTYTIYFTVDGVKYWSTYNSQTGVTNTNYSGNINWGGTPDNPYIIVNAVNPCGQVTDTLAMNDPGSGTNTNDGDTSGNMGNNSGNNGNGTGNGNNGNGTGNGNNGNGTGNGNNGNGTGN